MKRIALIVAGGSGTRMRESIPKQFMLLSGKPVLMHVIERFHAECDAIIVVLPGQWIEYWEKLCIQFRFAVPVTIVAGGKTRAGSVRNGLDQMENGSLVAVHDAARPLISKSLIQKLYISAGKNGNAIPVIPLTDSLRIVDGEINKAVDRNSFRLVQTPQCFHTENLKEAFKHPQFDTFADEASLAQSVGQEIHLVEGDPLNIKITRKEDLFFAEHYIAAY